MTNRDVVLVRSQTDDHRHLWGVIIGYHVPRIIPELQKKRPHFGEHAVEPCRPAFWVGISEGYALFQNKPSFKISLEKCSHICEHASMRKIKFYKFETGKSPVEEYFDSLTNKQFEKIAFVLDIIEQFDIVPRKFFKKLQSTDDIWEVRVQQGNNIFRILGFLDGKDLIILNHGFTKKSQKTPQKEIATAEKRKQNYYNRKAEK